MKPPSFMLIAGEASGDLLAAELVNALRAELLPRRMHTGPEVQPLRTALAPRFFGAGGSHMEAAGVELAVEMTQHSVIGLWEALRHYAKFRRIFNQLVELALAREPDVIVCVDFSGFNRRFAHAIRSHVRERQGPFNNWNPKIIQFVSPQVWASRPGRAHQLAADYDLLLSIFPFEKAWYAARVPGFRVAFVGHPMVERYSGAEPGVRNAESKTPFVVMLPGSRPGELKRHLPVMLDAWRTIQSSLPSAQARVVLPDEALIQLARSFNLPAGVQIQKGELAAALRDATLAIASTGTVTMECAFFGVPTVAIYKTSWLTYEIGKRVVTVKHLAMPNLLAGEELLPEFIQSAATGENIANASLELLRNDERRQNVRARLREVIASLGGPGATRRAARGIVRLAGLG